jgi:translation initiation factor 1 (eIF-1/SUI1)
MIKLRSLFTPSVMSLHTHRCIAAGLVRIPMAWNSTDKNYQDLLNNKNKIMLDMTIRPQHLKKLHPEATNLRAKLTQPPAPLKYKLQELPENYNPLEPLGNTEHLPFFIERSKSGNLPVYREYRHGRSKKMTVIRKIVGDVEELMAELKKICSNEDVEAKVGKIIIRGLHKRVVLDYLARLGF